MPDRDGRPLHEQVFQIKAAIRRAGFVAHGRVRLDQNGRVVMGVIVPVSFDGGDLTTYQVRSALRDRIATIISMNAESVSEKVPAAAPPVRPADLRSREGRAWKAAQSQEALA